MLVLLLTLLSQPPGQPTTSLTPPLTKGEMGGVSPQWKPGQEFLYRGSVKEEDLTQANQLINEYKLEIRALVLSVNERNAEVAFSTKLTQARATALPGTGAGPGDGKAGQSSGTEKAQESSIDLTVALIDRTGKITSTTHPHGTALLVDGPATWEHGWVLNTTPAELTPTTAWEVAQPGRLPCRYKVESLSDAELIVEGEQRSFDWDSPRADSTAWKRSDTLTLNNQSPWPQKITRSLERRVPAHQRVTSRLITEYELVSMQILDGPNLSAQQRDIQQVRTFQQQLQALAGTLGTPQARQEFQRLGNEMERFQASSGSTPYREALVSLQALVRAGSENRLAHLRITQDDRSRESEMLAGAQLQTVDGQSTITLSQYRGRTCLLIFLRPGTDLTRTVMTWIDALQRKMGQNKFICLFLYTIDDEKVMQASFSESAPRDHLLGGKKLAIALNINETPHFMVVDVDGGIAGRFTGLGPEPGRDLEKLLRTEAAKNRK